MTGHGVDAGGSTPKPSETAVADIPLPVPDTDVTAHLANYRQGDLLLTMTAIPVLSGDGTTIYYPAPHGTVIISQTCDVVQPTRVGVAVAPLVRIDEPKATEARNCKWPSLAAVPDGGDDAFADLGVVATIAKAAIAAHPRKSGVTDGQDVRRFGQAVGRKYARWAIPEEVRPWLAPLERILASKAGKDTSALGRVLEDVLEIRVRAEPSWMDDPPLELTVQLVVKAGVLPTFANDDLPDLPPELKGWFFQTSETTWRTPGEVADRLDGSSDPTQRYWLWQLLGQACAVKCRPRDTEREDTMAARAVKSVAAEVVAEDEYTYDQVRRTVQLDLDYLSPPLPE